MSPLITRPHRIDPISRTCLGCGLTGQQAKLTPDCPAFYRDMPGLTVVVTTAEKLVLLVPGSTGLRLDQAEMFATRDAIDEGVSEMREQGRSIVWKEGTSP